MSMKVAEGWVTMPNPMPNPMQLGSVLPTALANQVLKTAH